MKKFVIYKRLSKQDKSKTQHGFKSQRADIDLFLESVEDYEVIGEFQEFISGAADVKPELEKAMELCRQTGAYLLVAKVDRLSRRISQVSQLLEGDVKFNVATLGENADNFMIGLFALLAEKERDFIRKRISRAMSVIKVESPEKLSKNRDSQWHKTFTENRAKGLHKYQTTKVSRTNDKQIPLVNRLKSMISDSNGQLTQKQMCEKLTLEGFTNSNGGVISQGSLAKLIKKYNLNS